MNKKQLVVTFILAILMVSLLFVQRFFDYKFKNIMTMNSKMGTLQEHYTSNGKISYSLPDNWIIKETESGKYNTYNIEFEDKTNNIIGSLEVLNNNENVNVMAETDMNNMVLECSEQNIENFHIGKNKGVKSKYKTKIKGGYSYINSSYYIPMDDDEKVKVTFIVKEDNYNDDMTNVFNTIVRSINK